MAPVAAASRIYRAPARQPILALSLLNYCASIRARLRVIVASPRQRTRDTSSNRLHPVLNRTNVGGQIGRDADIAEVQRMTKFRYTGGATSIIYFSFIR